MDAKPHYFKIGLFILVAVALIVVAVVLFGAGVLARGQLYVESYFLESITGLSIGSPLEFRGVRIGQVEQIGFVGNVYELEAPLGELSPYAPYVRVVSAVERAKLPDVTGGNLAEMMQQMVERGLRVRVSSNILTGQAFLEVNYLDPNRFPVEQVPWVPRYPRIPSAPSELTTIKDSIDSILNELRAIDVVHLVESLNRVFTSLDSAISDANLAELSREATLLLQESRRKVAALDVEQINADAQTLLTSLNEAVVEANVPALVQQARGLLTDAERRLAAIETERINNDVLRLVNAVETAVAEANVPALSEEAQALMAELRQTNAHLQSLLAPPEGFADRPNLPELVSRLSQTAVKLNKLIATETPQVEAILAEFRQVLDNLNDLMAALKERPSSVFFSEPPPRSEVLE